MLSDYFNNLEVRLVTHVTTIRESGFHLVPTWNSLEFLHHGQAQLGFDGEYYCLEAPVLFWMSAGHEFHLIPDKKQKPFCDHFFIDMMGRRSNEIIDSLEKNYPAHFTKAIDVKNTRELFNNLLKYYRLDAEAYLPRIILTLEEIMVMLHEHKNMTNRSQEDIFDICRIADDIRINPFAEFDFEKMADEHEISYDYYRRLFKQTIKVPLKQYIRNQQMNHISEMLCNPTLRIKEIATSCGFDDPASFSRAFRKYSGLSPRKFRESNL